MTRKPWATPGERDGCEHPRERAEAACGASDAKFVRPVQENDDLTGAIQALVMSCLMS